MKTHNTTRMAMGVIYLMSLILFGCTQYGTAGNMDTASEGSMTEMTDKNMGSTTDTMKNDMGKMNDRKMESSMDTMKGGTMDDTKDKMMQDTSKDMMK